MKCAWVQKRLMLYLSEEIDPREATQVVRHLEHCERCAAQLEVLAENRDTLRDALRTSVLPPETLDARILERIQALPRRRRLWSYPLPVWNARGALALSACALLLLAMGFQWGRWNSRTSRNLNLEATAARPVLDLASLGERHRGWELRQGVSNRDTQALAERLTQQTGLRIQPLDQAGSELKWTAGEAIQMNRVPVATMRYDWKGTPVTLAQADGMRLAPPSTLREMRDKGRCFLIQRQGDLTFVLWCEGTDNFVLVARIPPPQLFALACQVCEKLQKSG